MSKPTKNLEMVAGFLKQCKEFDCEVVLLLAQHPTDKTLFQLGVNDTITTKEAILLAEKLVAMLKTIEIEQTKPKFTA